MESEGVVQQTLKLQDWLNEKSIKSLQEKSDLEAKNTNKMYSAVLDVENTFVKDMDQSIEHQKMLKQRKRELLHKRWTERVFEPIQKQIDAQMCVDNSPYEEMARRKRLLHKEYLEHVNKKGHVFLDTYAPEEYYPMGLQASRPAPLVAVTGSLQDPLLKQERQRNQEDRVMIRCTTGDTVTDRNLPTFRQPSLAPLVPLGRHGTGCNGWLGMPKGDIESPVRMGSRRRMKGVFNDSQIDFPAWSKLASGPPITEEELRIQKKRTFKPAAPRSAYAIDPDTSLAPSLPRALSELTI